MFLQWETWRRGSTWYTHNNHQGSHCQANESRTYISIDLNTCTQCTFYRTIQISNCVTTSRATGNDGIQSKYTCLNAQESLRIISAANNTYMYTPHFEQRKRPTGWAGTLVIPRTPTIIIPITLSELPCIQYFTEWSLGSRCSPQLCQQGVVIIMSTAQQYPGVRVKRN